MTRCIFLLIIIILSGCGSLLEAAPTRTDLAAPNPNIATGTDLPTPNPNTSTPHAEVTVEPTATNSALPTPNPNTPITIPSTQPTGTPIVPPSSTPTQLARPATLEPAPQLRALWVDAFHKGFHTPEAVQQLISDAKRAHINTLVVQVRRRGDAFYQSSLEPQAETADDPFPVPAGFDPLQALLDAAHNEGIEVHAWLASLPVWHENSRYQTKNAQHVWHQHGPDAVGADNWVMLQLNEDGTTTPTYALDPGHPAAAQYTFDVALDLIRHYAVDGLHLDYIRYGTIREGYNPVAVERFNRLYGRSGQPAPNDPDWLQWRRDQVTALVRRIYVASQQIDPRIKVSAAVITWGAGPTTEQGWSSTAAYASVLQDWRAWTEEGILDLAMPMNYYREYKTSEQTQFNQWIEWQKNHQYNRFVLAGPGSYLNYIEDTLTQLRRSLTPSSTGSTLPGVSLYNYSNSNIYSNDDYLWNTTGRNSLPRQPWQYRPELNQSFFTALSQTTSYTYTNGTTVETVITEPIFPQPAPVPPMPWKTHPTTGMLSGLIDAPGLEASAIDGLTILLSGTDSRSLTSDGNGWFGAVELPPGVYHVLLHDRQGQSYEANITIEAGQITPLELILLPKADTRQVIIPLVLREISS